MITVVKISDIITDDYYANALFDSVFMNELKSSVLLHGQVNPIIVTADPRFLLVSGRRLFRVLSELGRDTILCRVHPFTPEQVSEYRLLQTSSMGNNPW